MRPQFRQYALYLTTMIMEGCWLYALLAIIIAKAGFSLSTAGILLVYPAAFIFNRLLQRQKRLRRRIILNTINWLVWAAVMLLVVKVQLHGGTALFSSEWIVSVPKALGAILFEFRPELLILFGTAAVWWLGTRLAYGRAGFAAVVSEFQFGLVMLLVAFFFASQLDVSIPGSIALAMIFFSTALIGISVAHNQESTGWLSGFSQGHWTALLVISIGLVLAVGVLISFIVTPDFVQLVWNVLKWLVSVIMAVIGFILSLLPEPGPGELPPGPTAPPMPSDDGVKFMFTMPEALRRALQAAWAILFGGFILLALWRISSSIFAWLLRRLTGSPGAEFEPVHGAFRADLLGFLKRILYKLLRLRLPSRKAAHLPPETASVRQVYRQLLRWAAGGGHPRTGSQTPLEFYYVLAGLLPQAQSELELITERYVRARYGTAGASAEELTELKQSLQRVKENDLRRISTEAREKK